MVLVLFAELLEGIVLIKESQDLHKRTIAALTELFIQADADNSGELDTIELKNLCSGLSSHHVLSKLENTSVFLEKLDANSDGKITLDELIEGYQKYRCTQTQEYRAVLFIRQLFRAADEDNSGNLTKAEFQKILEQEDVKWKLFNLGVMDSDDFKEASETFDAFFSYFDEDDDGDLSVQEVIQKFLKIRSRVRREQIEKMTHHA